MQKQPFDTWNYKDQTRKKHEVFADYIDKWIKIVGAASNLNYIDGFAGMGAYTDPEGTISYGSPIIIAKTIQKIVEKMPRKVNILIIDENKKCLDNIKKIYEHEKIDIKPAFIADSFDKVINGLLDEVKNLAPTFVFVDPFGFKIKTETIKRIMSVGKSEIFLNFMFTRINQFLSATKIENVYDDLFIGKEWRAFKGLTGKDREKAVIEYYRRKLKEFCKYVYYYKIEFPDKKKTFYYLFHLTNHYLGCSIMKSSFAKFNHGRVEYRGCRSGQQVLFEQKSIKIDEVASLLKSKYASRKILFQAIIEENIDTCEYLESHFRGAVKEMEGRKEIRVQRIPARTPTGRAKTAIEGTDLIGFN